MEVANERGHVEIVEYLQGDVSNVRRYSTASFQDSSSPEKTPVSTV